LKCRALRWGGGVFPAPVVLPELWVNPRHFPSAHGPKSPGPVPNYLAAEANFLLPPAEFFLLFPGTPVERECGHRALS